MSNMLFGNILAPFRAKRAKNNPKPNAESARFLEILTNPEGFTPPSASAAKLLKLYRASPWVRAITGKVAGSVARQAWYFETPEGEKVTKHPFLEFLKAGSPKMRGKQALKTTQLHIDLAGEAFWAIGRNGSTPVQWAPIPPHWVTDIPRPGNPFYEIQPAGGQRFALKAEDVLAFRDADPFDPYERGTGVTEAAWTEVKTDEAAAEFLHSHFKNRARPDLLISGTKDKPMGQGDVPRLETSWIERFRGPNKAGRPLFSAQPLEVKELGRGLRDNETSNLRDQLKATISEVFGVPPELFGRLENSNRATIESADFLYGKHTLDPRLAFLLDVLEPFALEAFDLGDLVLRYESPVPEDLDRRIAVMTAFREDFTGNEVRAVAGLRPRNEPQYDRPKGEIAKEQAEAIAGATEPEDDEDEPDPEPPKPKKSLPATVERTLSPQGVVEVSAAHEDPQVRAEVSRIFDDIFGKLLERYGSELLETLSVEVEFTRNVRIANWLADEVPALLGYIDETTRKELAAALVEGVAGGEKLAALMARVDAVFAAAADVRAPLIGDTMATKLTGFASQDAAEQAGFERKMWLTSQDQVVRSSHRGMNRQTVGTKEKFRSPRGGAALHPGAFGEMSEDARCRCAMRPVLPAETVENAAGADDDFMKFHEARWPDIAKRITERARDVFAGQSEVAKAALRRSLIGQV